METLAEYAKIPTLACRLEQQLISLLMYAELRGQSENETRINGSGEWEPDI